MSLCYLLQLIPGWLSQISPWGSLSRLGPVVSSDFKILFQIRDILAWKLLTQAWFTHFSYSFSCSSLASASFSALAFLLTMSPLTCAPKKFQLYYREIEKQHPLCGNRRIVRLRTAEQSMYAKLLITLSAKLSRLIHFRITCDARNVSLKLTHENGLDVNSYVVDNVFILYQSF